MAYNHEFPYVDPNRYNADWAINTTKNVVKKVDELEKKIDDLPTGGDVTKEDLENLENKLQPQITQNDNDIDILYELDSSTTQDIAGLNSQVNTINTNLSETNNNLNNLSSSLEETNNNLTECRQVADNAYNKAYSNKEEIGERPEGVEGTLWENVDGSGGVSQEDFNNLKNETSYAHGVSSIYNNYLSPYYYTWFRNSSNVFSNREYITYLGDQIGSYTISGVSFNGISNIKLNESDITKYNIFPNTSLSSTYKLGCYSLADTDSNVNLSINILKAIYRLETLIKANRHIGYKYKYCTVTKDLQTGYNSYSYFNSDLIDSNGNFLYDMAISVELNNFSNFNIKDDLTFIINGVGTYANKEYQSEYCVISVNKDFDIKIFDNIHILEEGSLTYDVYFTVLGIIPNID